jgi:hypothetical protein
MILKDIVSLLANRINQPRVIECYLRKVYAKGYEAGTKQSPWISVKDKLPDNQNIVLVRDEYDGFCTAYLHGPKSGFITYGEEAYRKFGEITHWMPIPSFDEILEGNRDVLERIKEKGD